MTRANTELLLLLFNIQVDRFPPPHLAYMDTSRLADIYYNYGIAHLRLGWDLHQHLSSNMQHHHHPYLSSSLPAQRNEGRSDGCYEGEKEKSFDNFVAKKHKEKEKGSVTKEKRRKNEKREWKEKRGNRSNDEGEDGVDEAEDDIIDDDDDDKVKEKEEDVKGSQGGEESTALWSDIIPTGTLYEAVATHLCIAIEWCSVMTTRNNRLCIYPLFIYLSIGQCIVYT